MQGHRDSSASIHLRHIKHSIAIITVPRFHTSMQTQDPVPDVRVQCSILSHANIRHGW